MFIQTQIRMFKAATYLVEMTKMFSNTQKDRQIVIYPYSQILLSNKNEATDTCNFDESQKYLCLMKT